MKITIDEIRKLVEEELLAEKEGKKDACYHKVKSRYKVWPSAYASGALVKCRKVGAKNWGNSKKENLSRERIRELVETEFAKLNEDDSEGLRKWFGRKGEKGSKSGWVDCNTCRKDKKTGRKKCSACGRESGEKRAKYPKCRPTPSACSKPGNYGKKSKAGKKV
jgi:formylmethanofuran dehydrogenase subunit E